MTEASAVIWVTPAPMLGWLATVTEVHGIASTGCVWRPTAEWAKRALEQRIHRHWRRRARAFERDERGTAYLITLQSAGYDAR